LDGVRGYWNGQTIISKHGKEIMCPTWFIDQFPKDNSLDGEFWLGRGTLELTNRILQSSKESLDWKRVIFVVFDFPNSKEPYEIRIRDLNNLLHQQPSNHIQIIELTRCRGNNQIQQYLTNITDNGGEGLMVNKSNSLYYTTMRVDTLLKVKVYFIVLVYCLY
jgi:DNA ligase-1